MDQLLTPAHLHLAINHAPIIGLAVACIPVLIGILFRSRGALASGLVCVLLCVGTVPAIMLTGEEAQESFADGSVEPEMDAAGKSAFREHSRLARTTAPVAYAAGLLALVSLIGLSKFPRQAAWIAWAVLAGNAATIGLAVWTAEAGGRIRHPEFRAKGQQQGQESTDFSQTSSSMLPAIFITRPEETPAPAQETAAPSPSASPEGTPEVQPAPEAAATPLSEAAATPASSEPAPAAMPTESPAAADAQ